MSDEQAQTEGAESVQEVVNNTKEMLKCLFNSFDVCIENIQGEDQTSQSNQDEEIHPLPLDKRVAILTNRKECFKSLFSKYLSELG